MGNCSVKALRKPCSAHTQKPSLGNWALRGRCGGVLKFGGLTALHEFILGAIRFELVC